MVHNFELLASKWDHVSCIYVTDSGISVSARCAWFSCTYWRFVSLFWYIACNCLYTVNQMKWTFLSCVYRTFLPAYCSAKIIRIHQDFPELWSQMYCHLFMVHSVAVKSRRLFRRQGRSNLCLSLAHFHVTILGKLFTHMCLCRQAV